jgi:hypothetical protein
MPAIRRLGRRFLLLRCCRFAALAWVFLRRFGVRVDSVFRPLGRVTSFKRRKAAPKEVTKKACPGHPVFRLGEKYPR